MNTKDIITMIHKALAEAEEAIERTDLPDALRLMNTSYFVGQVHGLLDILLNTHGTMDNFVKTYEEIQDRLHALTEKEDIIYRRIR